MTMFAIVIQTVWYCWRKRKIDQESRKGNLKTDPLYVNVVNGRGDNSNNVGIMLGELSTWGKK